VSQQGERADGGPDRESGVGRSRPQLQQRVLRALAFGKNRKCLSRDQALEILACLVSREGCLIHEEPVKQELRRIVLARTDQEQLHPAPRPDESRRAGTKRLLTCCTASRGTENGRYRKSRHECQKADAAADTSQEWSAPFRRRLRKPAEHSLLRPRRRPSTASAQYTQRPSNLRKRACQVPDS
jgi:hypothetical protein